MSSLEVFKERCEEADVEEQEVMRALKAMSSIHENLKTLLNINRDAVEFASEISTEIGQLMGFSADQSRVSSEFKEEMDQEIIDLAQKLADELQEMEVENR